MILYQLSLTLKVTASPLTTAEFGTLLPLMKTKFPILLRKQRYPKKWSSMLLEKPRAILHCSGSEQENQFVLPGITARTEDLGLIRRSPYRPAALGKAAHKGRTQDRTQSNGHEVKNLLLHGRQPHKYDVLSDSTVGEAGNPVQRRQMPIREVCHAQTPPRFYLIEPAVNVRFPSKVMFAAVENRRYILFC